MKTIKILGTGCSKCLKTEELIRKEIMDRHLEVEVVKVKTPEEIMKYHVMATPGVVVDEKVVHSGSVPTPAKIREWL
ncbi:thioredoxin family protein [Deltaproteobacteria bacterium TL4]